MATIPIPEHPFYPPGLNAIGYAANTMSIPALLSVFAIATVGIIGVSSFVLKMIKPSISRADKILVGWFMFSGCIHFILEGYFVYNHKTMPRRLDLLGQMWKEYAKADSRYMTMEPFVLCMESITAFAWGPLCDFIAWMIVTESPHRHPTQIIVSYGPILRRRLVLWDKHLGGIPPWSVLLSSGDFLLLGILHLSRLLLDSYSRLLHVPKLLGNGGSVPTIHRSFQEEPISGG
ncbi:hypothetical protein N7501_006125 [Penicillium viridicatum]|nr:hypothetical protein N7501_006125 [Penicillium viridicatum]